tara:strand:- start:2526 stop:2765 length:240 start_codon:yes stop_codon:yes gene_type:complete
MCRSRKQPAPPPPPPIEKIDPVVNRARSMEDQSPEIEIQGDDELSEKAAKAKKNKRGTKKLNTSLGTGSMTNSGLTIPN